jgi:hypothetical protein
MPQVINRIRVALNLAKMKDDELHKLVTAIGALAPNSALMGVPAVAAAVGVVASQGTAFKAADDTVAADTEKLRNDKQAKAATRGTLENGVTALAGAVGANAKNAADVASMGLVMAGGHTVATADPVAPEAVNVKIPKKGHGRATVTVPEKGRFVAEQSPDPIGPATWAPLPGTGKSRTVTGATGTKVWIRFARVRGQLQSDWSTPILVTIP